MGTLRSEERPARNDQSLRRSSLCWRCRRTEGRTGSIAERLRSTERHRFGIKVSTKPEGPSRTICSEEAAAKHESQEACKQESRSEVATRLSGHSVDETFESFTQAGSSARLRRAATDCQTARSHADAARRCFMDDASSVAAESVFVDEFKITQNKTVKKGFLQILEFLQTLNLLQFSVWTNSGSE